MSKAGLRCTKFIKTDNTICLKVSLELNVNYIQYINLLIDKSVIPMKSSSSFNHNFIRTFSCNLHLITKNDMKLHSWTWFGFFVFVTQLFLEMVFLLHHKPIKKSLRERILYDSRITDVYKVRNKMQRQAVFNLEMNMYVWVNESITSIWGYINRPMKSAQVILYIFKLVLYFWLYAW